MCNEPFSAVDFGALQKALAAAISRARSLNEIEAWLKSQKCVKSVRLGKNIMKSNPPQRDFIVEFEMEDGSTVKKVVNIFDKGDQKFQFRKLRDHPR